MSDNRSWLSSEGQQRREQILLLAQREARTIRRQRLTIRAAGVTLILGIVCLATLPLLHRSSGRQQLIVPTVARGPIQPPVPQTTTQPSLVQIEIIQSDPGITDRLAIRPDPSRWQSVNDDELLEMLAQAGQPSGLVTMNGQTYLLPRSVSQQ